MEASSKNFFMLGSELHGHLDVAQDVARPHPRDDIATQREAEDRRRELQARGEEREAVTLDSLFGEIHKGNVRVYLWDQLQGLCPVVRYSNNLDL